MGSTLLKVFSALVLVMSSTVMAADLPTLLDKLGGGKTATSAQTLKETARWSGLPSWATSVAFSTDDSILAVGLKDRIQLVDIPSKSLSRTIEVGSGQIRSIAFSSDGKQIATAGYQKVTLFNASTGDVVQDFKGHRGYVTGVAFSRDGQLLASASEDETARIWTVSGDAPAIVLKGHGDPATGVAWSPDGTQLATSSGDELRPTRPGQVRIWDAASGALIRRFELHQRAATGVAFSPDGHFLLSSSVDEHVNVYDLVKNKPLGFFAGHSRPTNAVAVHSDGETAISVSGGRAVGKNELMVWELETGETIASVEAHEAKITSLAVSHDGRFLATASQDQSVALWNIAFLAIGLPAGGATELRPANSKEVVPTAEATSTDTAKNTSTEAKPKTLRVGIIGLDTSHAGAFTKTLNADTPIAGVEGCRVVAAYPKGSPDIKSSVDRVPKYTEEQKQLGVEIVDSIDQLLTRVDVVLLETNDGRPHFDQLLPCLKAGKPCFIDKPIAGSLSDAIAIFEAAKKYDVPVFSSSSLRFGKDSLAIRSGTLGKVTRAETSSPASLEATHPDLFWYGIHGVESLYTVMGTGCESVVRGLTPDGKIEVTGQWTGGRVGIFREDSGYRGKAVGESGEAIVGSYDGYDPLVIAIVTFFQTGKPPVSAEETLEIYAFMEAADESKRQQGASITLESVMTKARTIAMKKLAELE